MADEKQLIPIGNFDEIGIIKDRPGHIVPQNGFTDGRNIVFKNGSVSKRKGSIKALDDLSTSVINTVTSVSNGNGAKEGTLVFSTVPDLNVGDVFDIQAAIPAAYNREYVVYSISSDGLTITVEEDISSFAPYTSSGIYKVTPMIDFFDYWPAPNDDQYIEVQQNNAVSPSRPLFMSIRPTGLRKKIGFKRYSVDTVSQLNDEIVINGKIEILVGDKFEISGSNPIDYDGEFTVNTITYSTSTNKTTINTTEDMSGFGAFVSGGSYINNSFKPISYDGITAQSWQSTLFAGGYAYIINDGFNTPQYIETTLGDTISTPVMEELPGWDWQRFASDVHIGCKVIRGYKDVLVAGNLNEYPIDSQGVVSTTPNKSLAGTIRVSTIAAPGEIPKTWQPGEANNLANEFELSTTAAIQDIVPLQGVAIIYTNNSIHSLQFDSRGNPSVQNVADGYGAIETGAIIEYDGRHLVVGANDIYLFGGHPGSIQSVCDGKIRDFFYSDLNPTPSFQENIFILRDSAIDEIQIYYPSKDSLEGYADRYVAWNYRNNTWTINDADNAVSGVLAPVRGGGTTSGDITFTGVGNTAANAQTEKQTMTVALDSDFPAATTGDYENQEVSYAANSSAQASTWTQEQFSLTVPNNIIPFNEEQLNIETLSTFNSGPSYRTLSSGSSTTSQTNLDGTGVNVAITDTDYLVQPTISNSNRFANNDRFSASSNPPFINAYQSDLDNGTAGLPDRTHFYSTPTEAQGGNVLFQIRANAENGTATARATITFNGPSNFPDTQLMRFGVRAESTNAGSGSFSITGDGINNSNINISMPGQGVRLHDVWLYKGQSFTVQVSNPRGSGSIHSSAFEVFVIKSVSLTNRGPAFDRDVNIERKTYTVSGIESSDLIDIGVSGGSPSTRSTNGAINKFTSTSDAYTWSGKELLNDITGTHNGISETVISGINNYDLDFICERANGVTKYKLVNTGSGPYSADFSDAFFQVGDKVQDVVTTGERNLLNNGKEMVIEFDDGNTFVNRNYTLSLGKSDAAFTLTGDGSFPDISPAVSFPSNLNSNLATDFIVDYVNSLEENNLRATVKGLSGQDARTARVFHSTNSDVNLSFTGSEGPNATDAANSDYTYTATEIKTTYNGYLINVTDTNNNQVLNITRNLSASYETPTQIGEYLRDEIIASANASVYNTQDWYDNGSGLNANNDYVIILGTDSNLNFAMTVTTVFASVDGNASTNTDISLVDVLASDGTVTPDVITVKGPSNETLFSMTLRSAETIDNVFTRIKDLIVNDLTDGWTASLNTSTNVLTLVATQPGQYPLQAGGVADSVLTGFGVFTFDYSQGSGITNPGNLPQLLTASITDQGSLGALELLLYDPVRNVDDRFQIGGVDNADFAESIALHVNKAWPNWNATFNNDTVVFESKASDWVLAARTDVAAYDVLFTDRNIYAKEVNYSSGVTDNNEVVDGTSFTKVSQSTNFLTSQTQIGHPNIKVSSVTLFIDYGNRSDLNEDIVFSNAADANQMANDFATRVNSAAVVGLSAQSNNNVVSFQLDSFRTSVNNIIVSFDNQTKSGTTSSVSRTNGNNLAGIGAEPLAATGTLDPYTDEDRPYATDKFDLSQRHVILASQNSVTANGFGFKNKADPPNDEEGTSYTSYVERIQLPIDNSFEYRKGVGYVQLLVDQGSVNFKLGAMNAPGQTNNLYQDSSGDPISLKNFDNNEDYKLDFRTSGRTLNYYITDGDNNNGGWRVSGVGFKIERDESRGK